MLFNGAVAITEETRQRLAAKFEAILPHLDERQRRLLMGAEARALGHGGIRAVARAAGVREATVSAGAKELQAGDPPLGRTRRPGAGRKRAGERDPALRPALLALVEPDERGDPMSPLRWTTKSTRNLAAELTRQGHRIGADTVADLLREEGFSLQTNTKTLEGRRHPDRDGQFRYINERVKDHQDAADPVISVDTKKKELVGAYKNSGRRWRPAGEPAAVATHDFPDAELGKAIPYGIYDLAADTGWVGVGTDHDTAAFAVESIRRWWHGCGRSDYPRARRLLITADAGGSNGYRTRAWKAELAALAVETGLEITVCHFPPGTSTWNKIEHRLFCHLTMNWRGRPLTSHEVILNSIAATTTSTGLRVRAQLDTARYATGIKVTVRQMRNLPLERHDFHGDWNYTLAPREHDREAFAPVAAQDQPGPGRAWPAHPQVTGVAPEEWDRLVADAASARRAELDRRRGHRRKNAAAGGRPGLTLADRLLATFLRPRFGLREAVLAPLFGVAASTLNAVISQTWRPLRGDC